jgi:protein O-mannosyl-transferase
MQSENVKQGAFNNWKYIIFLFAAVGFLIYGTSFNNPFILDDEFQILKNQNVLQSAKLLDNFKSSTMSVNNEVVGIYYKPVMMMTYNLLWNAGKNTPFLFHVVQLLLHIVNSFFIFVLIKKLTDDSAALSLVAGLVYLVHPINSEAVLFIADMQEPLYIFFGLSALLIGMYSNLRFRFFALGILLLLSLLSKESGLLFVIAYIAYAAIYARHQLKHLLATIFTSISTYLALRFGVANLGVSTPHEMQIANADLITRLVTMPKVLVHYINLFFYPNSIALTQDWIVNSISVESFWLPLCELLLVLALITNYYFKTRSREFIFFAICFFAGWGLHSQLVPLDGTVSDRWFYFTMIGFLGMLVIFVKRQNKLKRFLILYSAVLLLVPLAVTSFLRTKDWRSPLALYQHDISISPDSFYLNNNLGLVYLSAGNYTQSIPYFEKTITVSKLKSNAWYVGWLNLGAAHMFNRNLVKAEEALKISINNDDIKAYRALTSVLIDLNKLDDAKVLLQKGFKRYPGDPVLEKLQNAIR